MVRRSAAICKFCRLPLFFCHFFLQFCGSLQICRLSFFFNKNLQFSEKTQINADLFNFFKQFFAIISKFANFMITFLLQRNDHHIFGQNCKFVQHSATMQEKKGDVEKKLNVSFFLSKMPKYIVLDSISKLNFEKI